MAKKSNNPNDPNYDPELPLTEGDDGAGGTDIPIPGGEDRGQDNTQGNGGDGGYEPPPQDDSKNAQDDLPPIDYEKWRTPPIYGGGGPPADKGGGGGTGGGGDSGNGDQGSLIAARLRELFSQGLAPSMNDPALASSRLTSQRNFENQRALLAERSGVEGTGASGGFDTNLLELGQDRGAADQAAVAGAQHDRVQQILQALGIASGNQNANNQLGLSYAQLEALLNAQGLQGLMGGG